MGGCQRFIQLNGKSINKMTHDGDGRSAGHDTMDRSKEQLWLWTTSESGYLQHVYGSNLSGQDPLIQRGTNGPRGVDDLELYNRHPA